MLQLERRLALLGTARLLSRSPAATPLCGTTPAALLEALDREITYAFQPIVNIHTGAAYGFEALLRGHEKLGFRSIAELINHSYDNADPLEVDLLLKRHAIERFATFGVAMGARLLFNVENRTLTRPGYAPEATLELLHRFGVPPSLFCAEISEQHPLDDITGVVELIRSRSGTTLFAIDDFGVGHSGLRLLSQSRADLVKIDRFFIQGVDGDRQKRMMLSAIVDLVHVSGTLAVAEGVETEAELDACRACGCDLVQGYFVARPTTDLSALRSLYPVAARLSPSGAALASPQQQHLRSLLKMVPPVRQTARMAEVIGDFVANPEYSVFPLLDDQDQPIGVISEASLKHIVYSRYGFEALTSTSDLNRPTNYRTDCLVVNINTPIDLIVRSAGGRSTLLPVVVVDDGRYVGMLLPDALLHVAQDLRLAASPAAP